MCILMRNISSIYIGYTGAKWTYFPVIWKLLSRKEIFLIMSMMYQNIKAFDRPGTRWRISSNTLVYLFFLVLLPELSRKTTQVLWKTKSGLAHAWNALEKIWGFFSVESGHYGHLAQKWPPTKKDQQGFQKICTAHAKNGPDQMKIVVTVAKMAKKLWLSYVSRKFQPRFEKKSHICSSVFHAFASPDFDIQSN